MEVTNREQVKQVVKDTLEKYYKVDILVNDAGIVQDAFVRKMTEEQWDRVVNVNLKGVFNWYQAVVEVIIAQGNVVIIASSSVVGLCGNLG